MIRGEMLGRCTDRRLLAIALAACTPDQGDALRPRMGELAWVEPLSAQRPAPDQLGGVAVLSAATDRPTHLQVWHDDGERTRVSDVPGRRVVHRVPFAGLTPGTHQLSVVATDDLGNELRSSWVEVVEPGIDTVTVETLVHDRARVGAGWLLLPLTKVGPDGPTYVLALDEDLRIAWWADPEGRLAEVQLDGEELLGSGGGGRVRVDLLGRVVEHEQPDLGTGHHDVVSLDDGSWWTLVERPLIVEEFPVDYDDLDARQGPVTLRDSFVTHVGSDGQTLARQALGDVLDVEKIGFDSLTYYPDPGWWDWAHANGLGLDAEGGVLVTARHLDAVIRFTPDLQLDWILGAHEGWGEAWAAHLLEPVGAVTWPIHPHAPEVLDDGTVVVFDNRNQGHTPYTEPPLQPPTSRAVGYRVGAGTVEEVWSQQVSATGPLYCAAVGDVDVDADGRVLVDYGFVTKEDGLDNVDAGRGNRSVRLVETFLGEDEPVLDVRISTDGELAPDGVHTYRVQRIGSLYGPLSATP